VTVLVLALDHTGMVGGGWWFTRHSNDLGSIVNNQVQPSGQSNVESFAKVQNVPSGLFSYGVADLGSHPWKVPRFKPFGLSRLRYTDPTTGAPVPSTGIKMLLNNQLAFLSPRPIKDENTKAQARASPQNYQ